jgi:RNA polymerase sigma-70 factor (ECF subfamily)
LDGVGGGVAERLQNRDEVQRMLDELDGSEAEVVRMYHLEGKSYQEISSLVGIPENSVGPTLSRARQKMRRVGADPAIG